MRARAYRHVHGHVCGLVYGQVGGGWADRIAEKKKYKKNRAGLTLKTKLTSSLQQLAY